MQETQNAGKDKQDKRRGEHESPHANETGKKKEVKLSV